jgi:hypothetical protein
MSCGYTAYAAHERGASYQFYGKIVEFCQTALVHLFQPAGKLSGDCVIYIFLEMSNLVRLFVYCEFT